MVDTSDCVYLDLDACGEMNATTAHEIIATFAEECRPDKSVYGPGLGQRFVGHSVTKKWLDMFSYSPENEMF